MKETTNLKPPAEKEKKLSDYTSHQTMKKPEKILSNQAISDFKNISLSQETKSEYDKEDNFRLDNDLEEETKTRGVEHL